MGKPSTFTQELADEICARLTTGEPLAQICRDEGMPAVRTVSDWRKAHDDFATAYAEARQEGFDAIAADALRIADTPIDGIIEKLEMVDVPNPDKPGEVLRRELQVVERRREDMLGHRKLQVDTRLKLLAKWDPNRYGERLHTEHSGEVVVHRKVFKADDDSTGDGTA